MKTVLTREPFVGVLEVDLSGPVGEKGKHAMSDIHKRGSVPE